MREDLRRQYLKALDVPCLVPRFILPGAAVSPRCEMPAVPSRVRPVVPSSVVPSSIVPPQIEPQAPSVSKSQRWPDSKPSSMASRVLVAGLMDPPPRAPVDTTAPVNPLQTPAEESSRRKPHDRRGTARGETADTLRSAEPAIATARFSLTLCRGEDWLVIEEGPAPNPGYLALLGNLLHACGLSGLVQGEDFRWPPPLNMPLQIDLSAAAAGQVLASRLQTLHRRQPLARLLLLGRRPPQLLDGWSGADGLQRLDLPVSLWQIMAEPEVKRELWLGLAAAGWL